MRLVFILCYLVLELPQKVLPHSSDSRGRIIDVFVLLDIFSMIPCQGSDVVDTFAWSRWPFSAHVFQGPQLAVRRGEGGP